MRVAWKNAQVKQSANASGHNLSSWMSQGCCPFEEARTPHHMPGGEETVPEVTTCDHAHKYNSLNSQRQPQYSWKSILKNGKGIIIS